MTVRAAQQGGQRFFDVPVRDFSLRELQDVAVGIYFDPRNGFNELPGDCEVSMVCGSYPERELQLSINIADFLKEKALEMNKMSFILETC